MKKFTLLDLETEALHVDNTLKPNSDDFQAIVTLLASVVIGPGADKVASFTHFPRRKVREWGANLRKAGVWKGRSIYCDWFDEKEGGLALTMDAMVARGLLTRA